MNTDRDKLKRLKSHIIETNIHIQTHTKLNISNINHIFKIRYQIQIRTKKASIVFICKCLLHHPCRHCPCRHHP